MRHAGRVTVLILVLILMVVPTSTTKAAGLQEIACEGLFPEPTPEHPVSVCMYEHVPYATFAYTNGRVTATWDRAKYTVLTVHIAVNGQDFGGYVPGEGKDLPIDPEKRYDFVGLFTVRETGDTIKVLTPVFCDSLLPPPTPGCEEGGLPLGCSVTSTTTCPDGTTVSVTCDGDTGSCNDSCASQGASACCESKQSGETTTSDGTTITYTYFAKKKQSCPSQSQ